METESAPTRFRHKRQVLLSLDGQSESVDVSIVVPLLNERENIEPLVQRLHQVLRATARNYEIILIDDGSTDGSDFVYRKLEGCADPVKIVCFRRNFGQTAALTAGFDLARGDVIITMDADLQNEPEDIPTLLEKIDQGYDIVSGWRVHRKDDLITRRFPSQIANRLISAVTGVKLHDYGCSLKAYRREVIDNIRLYGELHRFIPALASWMGVRVAEVEVNHVPRRWGRSKYGLTRVFKVVLDLLTVKFLIDYATRPIQVFGLLGGLCLSVGIVLGAYLSVIKLFFGQPLADRPLLLLAILLIVLGVQLITMGLLGEVVIRTYYEAQSKPTYVVREILEFGRLQNPLRAPTGSQDSRTDGTTSRMMVSTHIAKDVF